VAPSVLGLLGFATAVVATMDDCRLKQKVDNLVSALSGGGSSGSGSKRVSDVDIMGSRQLNPRVQGYTSTAHRAELLRQPKVSVEGPERGRFRASHRRTVSASSEQDQLSTVRDAVVYGPWRAAKPLAVGDSHHLEEGFRRQCVPGLYTALQAIHGSSSVCLNNKKTLECLAGSLRLRTMSGVK